MVKITKATEKTTVTKITISASKTYDVLVGENLLSDSGKYISSVIKPCTLCVVTDSNVDTLYADIIMSTLAKSGFLVCKFVFPAGETSKNMTTLDTLLTFLAEHQLTRSDAIVALGGGVTGDMAGFAAAVYLRGIDFVQIPTTLLAAVDSSVGGKTGINTNIGKNLIGAFWQPCLVICDCKTFDTLPHEILLDGIAEAIKYGVIIDQALFNYLASDEISLPMVVERCVAIKRDIVEQDERDTGRRQLLNFGHTIGHAIEKCSNYEISHGHAVAIGMVIVSKASDATGLTDEDCTTPIQTLLEQYGFDLDFWFTTEELELAALSDKKRAGSNITLITPKTIGDCRLTNLEIPLLKEFIDRGLNN